MKSICGVGKYDRLAMEMSEEFQAFIQALEENGWIVKATEKLPVYTVAQFYPRKGRFYYDPGRFTVLDMMHEQKHLELFEKRENWKTRDGQAWRDEIAAYAFEQELGKREGFATRYMEYLTRQIEHYQALLSAGRED